MKYLLDTNVLSDARRGTFHTLNEWIEQQPTNGLAISSITLFELEHGVRRMERKDQHQGRLLRRWLDDVVRTTFEGRVLPVDDDVAIAAAGLQVSDPMPVPDSLIAATALVHDLTIVTRNLADFERTGVPVLDPHAG